MPAAEGGLFREINKLRKDDTSEDGEEASRKLFDENTLIGRIALNKYFEYVTLGVIVWNALYLGYDCDYNARWGKPEDLYASSLVGFMFWDNIFCLFFTAELLIRFFGYKSKLSFITDIPFLFDLGLVTMMVLETWILAFLGPIDALKQASILRLLRLTRLLRMGKLLRYFPELQLIVKGMVAAVRSVGCAGILCMLVLYVFSIIFTNEYHQGLKADDDDDITDVEMLFGSMGKSMRHLLIMGTILDDITACTYAIRSSGSILMLFVFIACVIISSFTLFNMLLGILCEVVEATGDYERSKNEENTINDLMMSFFRSMDLDNSGTVSLTEFRKMQSDQTVMDVLKQVDIDHYKFNHYADLLFTRENEWDPPVQLAYNDIVKMIMRLRPGTFVNCLDFTYFKNTLARDSRCVDRYLDSLLELLEPAAGPGDESGDEVPPSNHELQIVPSTDNYEDPPMDGDMGTARASSESHMHAFEDSIESHREQNTYASSDKHKGTVHHSSPNQVAIRSQANYGFAERKEAVHKVTKGGVAPNAGTLALYEHGKNSSVSSANRTLAKNPQKNSSIANLAALHRAEVEEERGRFTVRLRPSSAPCQRSVEKNVRQRELQVGEHFQHLVLKRQALSNAVWEQRIAQGKPRPQSAVGLRASGDARDEHKPALLE